MSVSASFTALRQDLQRVSDALAETTLSASVLMRPEGSTTDYFSIHLPYFTTPVPDKSEASRAGGPRTQTINVPPELGGIDRSEARRVGKECGSTCRSRGSP